MKLQENEYDSGPRFCTPFPSGAIGAAFENAFVDEAYLDESEPEWLRNYEVPSIQQFSLEKRCLDIWDVRTVTVF